MDHAGKAIADLAKKLHPDPLSGPVFLISGKGNNGGDAFVAARYLWNEGYDTKVRILGSENQYPEGSNARVFLTVIKRLGIDVASLSEAEFYEEIQDARLLVDGLFGHRSVRRTATTC